VTVKGGQVNWSVKPLPVSVWGTTAWTSIVSFCLTVAFLGTLTLMRVGSQVSISAPVTLLVSAYKPKLIPVIVTREPTGPDIGVRIGTHQSGRFLATLNAKSRIVSY